MKHLSIIILSSFVAATVFSFSLALAADTPVKVYYSESLGTKDEDKVYHVTSCMKAPSYGPVRCLTNPDGSLVSAFDDNEITGGQCRAPNNNSVLDGAYVRGCYVKQGGQIQYEEIQGGVAGTDNSLYKFPKVEVKLLKNKSTDETPGCADKPEEQGPLYAPEYAILDIPPVDLGDNGPAVQLNLLDTVVWPGNSSGDSLPSGLEDYANSKYPNSEYPIQVMPMYRPVLCDEYDVLAAGQGTPVGVEMSGQGGVIFSGMTEAAKTRNETEPKPTKDEQCNTNNSSKGITDLPHADKASTILDQNPTYSCSTRYLIMGGSGSAVLSQYIGALYKWAAGLVGIISVLIIVFSGIQISAAGGDSAKLDTAKNRIAQSIIGLVILFLAGLILYTINPTFFVG